MKIIYIDMDGVLCNYNDAHEQVRINSPQIKYPQSIEGFFLNLEPIDGAINAFKHLFNNPYYDVYILTAPSIYNPLC